MQEYQAKTEVVRGKISDILIDKCDAKTAIDILNLTYKMRAEYEERIAGLMFILVAALVTLAMMALSAVL